MMIKRFFVFTLFLIGIFSLSFSQLVTIKTQLDTNKIVIGDRVELKYILEKSNNDRVIFPDFHDTLALGVEVLVPPVVDSIKLKGDKTEVQQKLILTVFEEGIYYIPSQSFVLKSKRGTDSVFSASTYLEVVGVEIDTTGTIRDIASVQKAPIIFRDFLPVIILIAIAIIVLLIIYFVRKQKRNKGLLPEIKKPKEPAHVIALRELDKLKAQKLWQQQKIKDYYSRLTNIIRTYIEDRYGIMAMEKPSSEILKEIRQKGLAKEINLPDFEGLLNLADLVKFAKGDADPEDNIKQLDNAYNFIKTTFLKEEVVEVENVKIEFQE